MTHLHLGGTTATTNDTMDHRSLSSLIGHDASACCTALIADTDSPVIIVDPMGKIVYANDLASSVLSTAGSANLAGRSFQEFYPIEFANDRLTFIRAVAANGKPLAVEGMVNGAWYRTTLRRLTAQDGSTLILMIFASGPRALKSPIDGVEIIRGTVDDQGPLSSLTHRETEILKLIGDGLSTADIARELHRSVKTIEWHRVSLGNKLKATNRVELARIAIKAGLSKLGAGSAKIDRPLTQTVA